MFDEVTVVVSDYHLSLTVVYSQLLEQNFRSTFVRNFRFSPELRWETLVRM